jgi:hypothetical protein
MEVSVAQTVGMSQCVNFGSIHIGVSYPLDHGKNLISLIEI